MPAHSYLTEFVSTAFDGRQNHLFWLGTVTAEMSS